MKPAGLGCRDSLRTEMKFALYGNDIDDAHTALEAGDYGAAGRLIAGMRAFEDIRAEELNGTNVTGMKAALLAQGHDCGPTRPPSAWPLTPTQQGRLDTFMAENGLAGDRGR